MMIAELIQDFRNEPTTLQVLTLLPTHCSSFVSHGIGALALPNMTTQLDIHLIACMGGHARKLLVS